MRTSRDVLRPLAALVVVLAAVALVSNVAAYRAATTTARHADHVGGGTCPKVAAASDHDGDRDGSRLDAACPATAVPDGSTPRSARSDDDGDGDVDESREHGADDDGSGGSRSDGGTVTVVTETGAS